MGKTMKRSIVIALACAGLAAHGAFAHGGQAGFATSFESGDPALLSGGDHGFAVAIGNGPDRAHALTAKPEVGFTGLHALRYQGTAGGAQSQTLFRVDVPVRADTQLSYLVFPQRVQGDLRNPSNYVAVDLLFDDGSRLSTTGALDQHRIPATAKGQGEGRVLYPDQWNRVAIDLGKVAAGRRVVGIALDHDGPAAAIEGWIDDIRVAAAPVDTRREPADYVDTRRGSNANGRFSRGNNFPATAVPHGFNFWTPVTRAGSNWLYQYQESNGPDNRPRIQAFALSHEPSPWMGDRQTFQVMPEAQADGTPVLDRDKRALSFSHDHETAHAHGYEVRFDNGIDVAMAPTDHAAIMRFTFVGDTSQLVFDNLDDHGSITLDPSGRSFHGWSEVKSGLSTGATRLFFVGTVDQPVVRSGRLTGGGRDHVAAWFGFDTRSHKTVNLRIATSLIGVEQAKHNLALEIAAHDTLETVRARAKQQWNDMLGRIHVQGASAGELTALYSNLYRLSLYPNEAFENVGTAAKPDYRYASPFSPHAGADTDLHTGARVLAGRPYVNNGLWDTYRTAWPAYTLLYPTLAGQMIDGFVQQYRDGGWIARWSSPGYADLMVGTSADVAFADAWLKGIRNFDVVSFYRAALKDATVVSPIAGTGRKGLARSVFNGYVDDGVSEGLSWSMAGYLNDFGIGQLAAALARQPVAGDRYTGYADDAAYFTDRARDYVRLFDPAVGFFMGRDAKGAWRTDAAHFDPKSWGGDYTETNAWNMAFEGVQDGQGLANLYGGRAGLAKKLDRFFGEDGHFDVGAYGGVIHEMLEARDVRMGQYGHSNQPSHHILYMYDLAGEPWKTQDKVRDALSRLYVGSSIGQGYPGDEDNGEMSAWYVLSAAGFYPLRMGTPTYAIGAPYFPHMDIALENGKHIVIDAPGVSDTNRYIQSVRLNGRPYDKTWLRHADLAAGAHLEFTMGPKPSRWGSGDDAMLPSLTTGSEPPAPWRDQADVGAARVTAGKADAHALSDNTSDTELTLADPHAGVTLAAQDGPRRVLAYTLTSSARAGADPSDWTLQGSDDGRHWTELDARHGERFDWRRQTRAFVVKHPGAYRYYRWTPSGNGPVTLAEIEWLGPPDNGRLPR